MTAQALLQEDVLDLSGLRADRVVANVAEAKDFVLPMLRRTVPADACASTAAAIDRLVTPLADDRLLVRIGSNVDTVRIDVLRQQRRRAPMGRRAPRWNPRWVRVARITITQDAD